MALNSQAKHFAPGKPGIEPRWTRGAKVAVGTAYSTSSRVWYTLDSSCVTEVYYPTIEDTPSRTTAMGIDYADIAVPNGALSLQFTFLWVDEDRWEGKEYNVQVRAPGAESRCE